MDIEAFRGLEGNKLSIATNKQKENGTPESYIGFLDEVGEDFVVLDYARATTNSNNTIAKVIILTSTIVGVWVYSEE